MAGKGRQAVPEGRKVMLSLPGGAGYRPAAERSRFAVLRDLALGYVSAEMAKAAYDVSDAEIAAVEAGLKRGELPSPG